MACVSWPIPDPDRKAFMNAGFQFNYNMPFDPSSFYNPMYWPSGKRDLLDGSIPSNDTHADDIKNKTKRYTSDVDGFDRKKYYSELDNQKDISAGELYKSLEALLVE